MTVPIEAQEIYVKNLEVLFDGAVKAEPWQINQEVIALCINNARANWRTRVELALLDI